MTALSSLLVALTLSVPFLPQTRALCGGAAVAMVFRYHGDRHADVQQFESLVDRHAGGIATDVLVEAVRERQWRAVPLAGSIELLHDHLSAGTPLVLLLEDRPGRYHYVVAVGTEEEAVLVHDPTWGPFRRIDLPEFIRRWAAAKYWTLLIQPDGGRSLPAVGVARDVPADDPVSPPTKCDLMLDEAIDEIAASGLPSADRILGPVMRECPRSAGPVAELAGIRFAQERWDDAQALAEQAIDLDETSTYAWDVLGSARFVRDDPAGALIAWNRIGKPTLDAILIDGLARTRYALVAQFAGLTPNTPLTAEAYRLAERRLRELPDQVAVRVGYTPDADGYAALRVALAERRARPHWLTVAARAAVGSEVRATLPGWSGQGEMWQGSWRWWSKRPRLALDFSAPHVGALRGVSRFSGAWEREAYALGTPAISDVVETTTETRVHGSLTTADWVAPDLRFEITVGADSWNGSRRTASLGGALDRRLLRDRLSVSVRGRFFAALSGGPSFSTASLAGSYRSSRRDAGLVHTIDAGFDAASSNAPFALWSGAGDGMTRRHLLRAHPLLVDDLVAGPVFGRRLAYLTAETRRWFSMFGLARLAVAGFVDAAGAARGVSGHAPVSHVDAGGGIRMRLPGAGNGVIRADYARGLRDGRQRFSVGIVADRF